MLPEKWNGDGNGSKKWANRKRNIMVWAENCCKHRNNEKKKKKDEITRGGWSWNMKRTWCGVWNESGSCTTKGLRASNIHTNDRTIFIPLEANRFNFIFILFRCVWIVCVSLSGVQCSYDIWVLFFYYFFLLCFRFFGTVHFSFKVIRFWLLLGQF